MILIKLSKILALLGVLNVFITTYTLSNNLLVIGLSVKLQQSYSRGVADNYIYMVPFVTVGHL